MTKNPEREELYRTIADMPAEDAKVFEAFLIGYRNGIQTATKEREERKEATA